jgi:hypothetical protein
MRRSYATLVPCLVLAVGACGDEPTEAAKAADAYNALVEAVKDRDYAEACERLTPDTRRDLAKAGQIQQTPGCGKTLERVVADVGTDKDAMVTVMPSDVRIDGPARAAVNQVRLSKADGEWQVEGDIDFVRPFLSGAPSER